jgi:hypothetical protein
MPDEIDVYALTPEQAGAKLAAREVARVASTAAPLVEKPGNHVEARTRLDALKANPDWSTKFLSGDVTARDEYDSLNKLIATADPVDLAMSGTVPDGHVDSGRIPLRDQAAAVVSLRDIGISEDAIRQVLSDQNVDPREIVLAERWKKQHMGDAAWVSKLMAGDIDARRELTLANIITSSRSGF